MIGSLEGDGSVWLGNQGTTVCTLTLGGDNASTSFYGQIGDTGRTFALGINGGLTDAGCLTKVGTGTFTMYGQNWYAGATTVDNGTLVNNGLILGTVNVTPGTGGQTPVYGGTGMTEGLVTVNAGGTVTGTGILSGGLTSVGGNVAPNAGTLTVCGLTLNSATNLYYAFGSTSGLINASGGSVSLGNAVLNATAGAGFAAGTYTLVNNASSVSGSLGLGNLPLGGTYLSYSLTTSASQVSLTVARNTSYGGTFNWTRARVEHEFLDGGELGRGLRHGPACQRHGRLLRIYQPHGHHQRLESTVPPST